MVKVVVVKADTYDEQVVALVMKELFDELGYIYINLLSLGIRFCLNPICYHGEQYDS